MSINYASLYTSQKEYFHSGAPVPVDFRINSLKKLRSAVKAHEKEIEQALYADLRKSTYEAFATEFGQVIMDIEFTLSHIRSWTKPQRVTTPLILLPSSSRIIRDPLGTVLVIGPWNYPFLLTMAPLVSAIAGGNTVFVKPSEEAPNTAAIVEKIIGSVFEECYVKVVQGIGAEVIPELMAEIRFDHIFFTGSTVVGQKIMELAAKKLVPVTLELGGKSPAIVDASANLDYAARKIAWSKFVNAGQTCVAPDYVLVHQTVKNELVDRIKKHFAKMAGGDARKSEDLGRIINKKHFKRLEKFLQQGKVLSGGGSNEEDLYIEPTLLDNVSAEDTVMKEEIFGPILPIITYRESREVIEWVEKNPFPLALYVYAEDKNVQQYFTSKIRFGGGCINNGIIHLGNPHLPFGGVGYSGTGQYHGKFGFDTFTRPKSILHSRSWFDIPILYAPYRQNVKWMKKIFKLS